MIQAYESSRSLQGRVEEFSEAICLAGEQSAQSNTTPMPVAYYWPDKTTEHSRLSRFGMTSEPLMEIPGEELLTWYREASPARTYLQPAKALESTESEAGYGAKWQGSFAKYSRDSSLWKTVQCSLLADSDGFSETWPRWGSMRSGVSYLRQIPALPICVSASGLWPTPNALPATSDLNLRCSGDGRTKPNKLGWAVAEALRPTPCARDYKGVGRSRFDRTGSKAGECLPQVVGGQLNPDWVEWLMGWPIGWTDLKPLETAKFQEWRRQHSIF